MKIFSKIMATLVLAAMTVSVAACGPSEVNRGGGGKELPSIDNPWWSTVGELEKDADGNIVFSDVQINLTSVICGNDQSGFESLLRQFEREYDNEITISHQTYNQLEIDDTVRRQIQNETAAPDLVLTHQKTHASFAADELIQPMDEAYELAGLEGIRPTSCPILRIIATSAMKEECLPFRWTRKAWSSITIKTFSTNTAANCRAAERNLSSFANAYSRASGRQIHPSCPSPAG